jgi:chemotaxis protein MotB
MKKRLLSSESENKNDEGRWLITYSDMMNNLLILFIVLYAMSALNLNKFKALAQTFNPLQKAASGQGMGGGIGTGGNSSAVDGKGSVEITPDSAGVQNSDAFDELYDKVKQSLIEKGYSESISVERGVGFIYFRFKDTVLFYPDSPEMKPSGRRS